jgi:carbon storage regulator
MLVLSRHRDETIMLGVDIRGDKVRLGIRAPEAVTVHRKEIWEAIRQENQRAASSEAIPQFAGEQSPQLRIAAAGISKRKA